MRRVAQRLAALRQEKLTLDRKKDQLMARLRSASDDERVGVQAELENLLVQQRELAALLDLQQVAKLFDEELQIPEDYVHLEQRQIQLDGMGVVRQSDEAVCSHPVDFTDLVGMDRRHWTVVLVRYRYQDSPSMAERMENASRWLYA
jgi:vacuolar-type H+-ATPase subunit D/Vma8